MSTSGGWWYKFIGLIGGGAPVNFVYVQHVLNRINDYVNSSCILF